MAQPAVQGDIVQGLCLPGTHLIIGPLGVPTPSPAPLPFIGPLQSGLEATVTIMGKPVAVVGSSGNNTPPHIGLHATDPAQLNPMLQVGQVMSGSPTVTFGGKPAATTQSQCKICGGTATIQPTVFTVSVD